MMSRSTILATLIALNILALPHSSKTAPRLQSNLTFYGALHTTPSPTDHQYDFYVIILLDISPLVLNLPTPPWPHAPSFPHPTRPCHSCRGGGRGWERCNFISHSVFCATHHHHSRECLITRQTPTNNTATPHSRYDQATVLPRGFP